MKKRIFVAVLIMLIAMHCVSFGQEQNTAIQYAAMPTLEYDNLMNIGGGYFKGYRGDKTGTFLLDASGKELGYYEYDNIEYAGEDLFCMNAFRDGEFQYGYMNRQGEIVIPMTYRRAHPFSEGLARVAKMEKEPYFYGEGFLDTAGNIVVPAIYSEAGDFSEGLARVSKNGKYGYIDSSGRIVIPLQYDYAEDFYNGYARVVSRSRIGYIDSKGAVKVPFDYYAEASDFVNDKAFVIKMVNKQEVLVIDRVGNVLKTIPCSGLPELYHSFSAPVFSVRHSVENGVGGYWYTYTYYDQEGKEATEDQLALMDEGVEGLLLQEQYDEKQRKNKMGFVDWQGNVIIPYLFDSAGWFLDGYAVVKLDGKYGIIKNPQQ